MKIDKVMNNNVVSSIDEDGQEIIVVGTGIGFQGKEGKVVDKKKIQMKEPVKSLGMHLIQVRLHTKVTAELKVSVQEA